MNPNVVSEQYIELQKGIMKKQNEIRETIHKKMNMRLNPDDFNQTIPVLPQLNVSPVPVPLYKDAVETIRTFLQTGHPELAYDLTEIKSTLTDEALTEWIKAAITFNTAYFQNFSEGINVDPWLPHFVAEQALRPFLQIIGEKCVPFLHQWSVMGTCPCCGEPPRIAMIEGEQEKLLLCPRCESKWHGKPVSCMHCGEDRSDNIIYITVEEDSQAKIEVCKTCRNYLKAIDSDQLSKVKEAAMLDLETIHLDFIAQQEGYGDE